MECVSGEQRIVAGSNAGPFYYQKYIFLRNIEENDRDRIFLEKASFPLCRSIVRLIFRGGGICEVMPNFGFTAGFSDSKVSEGQLVGDAGVSTKLCAQRVT
jgi:hypothetical protein